MKAKEMFWFMYYMIIIVFVAWLAVSYIDIVIDNTLPNPTHFDWNFFVLLLGGLK